MRALVALVLIAAAFGCARHAPDAGANLSSEPVPTSNSSIVVASAATPEAAHVADGAARDASSPRPSAIPKAAAPSPAETASTAPSADGATPSPAATGPQILSVVATPAVVHAGQTVSWDVRTTRDIVTVAANVSAYHLPLQRSGPGHFVLNFTVPSNVPGFFHGTYALDVRGQTASGTSADRHVSLVFQ